MTTRTDYYEVENRRGFIKGRYDSKSGAIYITYDKAKAHDAPGLAMFNQTISLTLADLDDLAILINDLKAASNPQYRKE